ncbi:MAG: hypothetical protein NTW26_00395, partial [bacterium]|nr:hypothetical protein [bacterium]
MRELGQFLAKVRNRLRAARWARRALLLLVALGAPLPLVLFAVAAGLPWFLGWLGWLGTALFLYHRPLLTPWAVTDIPLAARTLESTDRFLGDELSSAAELLDSPSPFARLQVRRAERLLAAANPSLGGVWQAELKRPLTGALGALLVFGLGVLIGPGGYDLGWRGMLGGDTLPPVPRLLEVEPGNLEVAPGTSVTIRALFNHPPQKPVLRHRPLTGGPWRETPLEPGDDPLVFSTGLPPVDEPLEYQVSHGAGAGEKYTLTLLPSPRLSGLRLKISPPAYTGLPPRELPPGEGNVIAPVGSRIGLEALATPELSAAGLEFETSPAVPVEPLPLAAGSRLVTSFTLRQSEGWNLRLTAVNGLESASPRYRLMALPDEPPTIALDEPGGAVDLDITLTVPVSARVADDYGVSSLALVYSRRAEGGGVGEPMRIVIARNLGLTACVDYRWNLAGVDLLPGEELLCRLEVTDNDAFAGPKTTSSVGFVVRYPGIEEIVEGETFAGPMDSLEELGEREERLAQRMEELAREHRGEEQVGSEEQRQLRRLADEQEQAVTRAEEIVHRLEDTLNTLYDENLITPESFAKLSEVQGLLEKVLDERLKAQLDSLQRAVENLDRAEIERLAA